MYIHKLQCKHVQGTHVSFNCTYTGMYACMYTLVCGNAAVNVGVLVSVNNDEGEGDGRVGRRGAILHHLLPVALDQVIKSKYLAVVIVEWRDTNNQEIVLQSGTLSPPILIQMQDHSKTYILKENRYIQTLSLKGIYTQYLIQTTGYCT